MSKLAQLQSKHADLSAKREQIVAKIVALQHTEQEARYESVKASPNKNPVLPGSPVFEARKRRAKAASELENTEATLKALERAIGEEAEVASQKANAEAQKKHEAWDQREQAAWKEAGEKLASLYTAYQKLQAVLAGRSGPPYVQFEYQPVGFDGWLAKMTDAALELQCRGYHQVNEGFVAGKPLRHLDAYDHLVELVPDLTSERSTDNA